MNSLSWLLYAADIIPKFFGLFAFLGTVGGIFLGGVLILWSVISKNEKIHDRPLSPPVTLWITWIFCSFMGVLALLFPSKQTLYLIAASEAGEHAVMSDTGQQVMSNIQEVIKLQIRNLKGTAQ